VELYPRGPAAHSEHWPEPEAEAEPLLPEDEETEEIVREPTEAPVDELAAQLQSTPLADELRERVDAWLRSGEDPALEAALGTLGDNPMQVAFNLLHGE
jgi:hypothetical protein